MRFKGSSVSSKKKRKKKKSSSVVVSFFCHFYKSKAKKKEKNKQRENKVGAKQEIVAHELKKTKLNKYKVLLMKGEACVQWLVSLDTLQCRHVSKIGYVFVS